MIASFPVPAQAPDPCRPPGLSPANRPADDLERLGEEIALLAAQLTAATYRLLVMIREFDERAGWECGFRSCAHWLNWRTGLDLGAAREKVRVARALGEVPKISEAMRHGEVSYSKVRALTRVATADNEEGLLELARAGTAAHVEKLVRIWRRVDRIQERERDDRRRNSRYLHVYTDDDGMVVVRGRLEPEAGAALQRALDAAGDKLYREGREGGGAQVTPPEVDYDGPEQRRADALGLVAESALSAGLDPGTRGDRFQVVVHVDAAVLAEDGPAVGAGLRARPSDRRGGPPCPPVGPGESTAHVSAETSPPSDGLCHIEGAGGVSAETSRRLACDASRVIIRHDGDGNVLDVGRRTRAVPPAMRRALSVRDGGCRFPGCGLKLCDAHHVEHWADGGATKLDNLLLVCRRHHRALHEEGYRVILLEDGTVHFFRPDGRQVVEAPPLPRVEGGAQALARRLARERQSVNAQATLPSWEGGPVDWASAIDGLGLHESCRVLGEALE
ncbi:MAG TPA: DUF222 domain-containing protein [Thermoanaerobaculia bacterium]|nr:DUF222 domain-containing protein [Thermoanaerobaculia bacterium]